VLPRRGLSASLRPVPRHLVVGWIRPAAPGVFSAEITRFATRLCRNDARPISSAAADRHLTGRQARRRVMCDADFGLLLGAEDSCERDPAVTPGSHNRQPASSANDDANVPEKVDKSLPFMCTRHSLPARRLLRRSFERVWPQHVTESTLPGAILALVPPPKRTTAETGDKSLLSEAQAL
jgi:hypothetical protein